MTFNDYSLIIQKESTAVQSMLRDTAVQNLLNENPEEIGSSDISCEAVSIAKHWIDHNNYNKTNITLMDYIITYLE